VHPVPSCIAAIILLKILVTYCYICICQAVFDRQWTQWKNKDEMKCRDQLHKMINNETSPLKRLPSFSEVIVRCQGLLDKIMARWSRPFLVQAAQQVCEKVEADNNALSSASAAQKSPVKFVLPTSPVQSPAKNDVLHSNKNCAVTLEKLSEKDEQKYPVTKSPAKQSTRSTVATDSTPQTADSVLRSESAVKPSTSTSTDMSDVEISDKSDSDFDDNWWRPSSKRAKKRAVKKPWSTLEEELVYKGVQAHGAGSWALIHANFLTDRSNVDIKDKWRTMIRQGRLRELAHQFGPLPLN